MMKRTFIIYLIILIFVLFITGCVGTNGNPTELAGTWTANSTLTDSSGKQTEYDRTLTLYDNGVFKLDYIETQNYLGGSTFETTFKGSYYGNPSDTPKQITFQTTLFGYTIDNVVQKDDFDGSIQGSYYVEYLTKTKLFLSVNDSRFSETYVKN
jgi:hypothetical protein